MGATQPPAKAVSASVPGVDGSAPTDLGVQAARNKERTAASVGA